MTENDKTDTSRSISDEELMKNEVIGDDADLYYLMANGRRGSDSPPGRTPSGDAAKVP